MSAFQSTASRKRAAILRLTVEFLAFQKFETFSEILFIVSFMDLRDNLAGV